jgi:hypothetical protein
MSVAAWALFSAQTGVNLLAAHESAQRQGEIAGAQEAQAIVSGELERAQIRRQAQQSATDRQRALAEAIGSQRAAMGAAGVAGGRTARLMEAKSRLRAQEAQHREDLETQSRLAASQYGQRAASKRARERVSAAQTQSYLDFLGAGAKAGRQGMKLWEQQQAGKEE